MIQRIIGSFEKILGTFTFYENGQDWSCGHEWFEISYQPSAVFGRLIGPHPLNTNEIIPIGIMNHNTQERFPFNYTSSFSLMINRRFFPYTLEN